MDSMRRKNLGDARGRLRIAIPTGFFLDFERPLPVRLPGPQFNLFRPCFGPRAFEGMTEQEAIQRIHDNRFDAVLTIVLLDKEKEKQI